MVYITKMRAALLLAVAILFSSATVRAQNDDVSLDDLLKEIFTQTPTDNNPQPQPTPRPIQPAGQPGVNPPVIRPTTNPNTSPNGGAVNKVSTYSIFIADFILDSNNCFLLVLW